MKPEQEIKKASKYADDKLMEKYPFEHQRFFDEWMNKHSPNHGFQHKEAKDGS